MKGSRQAKAQEVNEALLPSVTPEGAATDDKARQTPSAAEKRPPNATKSRASAGSGGGVAAAGRGGGAAAAGRGGGRGRGAGGAVSRVGQRFRISPRTSPARSGGRPPKEAAGGYAKLEETEEHEA